MTLATLRTSFSRPESEVICSYVASAGIPAVPAERHRATFARHRVANALVFLCVFAGLGFVYFLYWARAQRGIEISERPLSSTDGS